MLDVQPTCKTPNIYDSFYFQSDDCTVFFFTVGETYKPIGFIETASPVVSMEWSKNRKVRECFCTSTVGSANDCLVSAWL